MDEQRILASAEWHFLSRYPPVFLNRPFDILMFRGWIYDSEEAFPGFIERLRLVARYAIQLDEPEVVRQGLQCLATVGIREDLDLLHLLKTAVDPLVLRDHRTCLFEIEKRRT